MWEGGHLRQRPFWLCPRDRGDVSSIGSALTLTGRALEVRPPPAGVPPGEGQELDGLPRAPGLCSPLGPRSPSGPSTSVVTAPPAWSAHIHPRGCTWTCWGSRPSSVPGKRTPHQTKGSTETRAPHGVGDSGQGPGGMGFSGLSSHP